MQDVAALDRGLRTYLDDLARQGGFASPTDIAKRFKEPGESGENEISNRVIQQGSLRELLLRGDYTADDLKKQLNRIWSLSGRFDSVWRTRFFESGSALQDIKDLLDEGSAVSVEDRINSFINRAIEHGFRPKEGKPSKSAVGLFASVLLSSVHPKEIVDFRKERWNALYMAITGSKKPLLGGGNYGQMIRQAGQFASLLAQTRTYQELFGEHAELWSISGLAWALKQGAPSRKRYWAGGFLFGGTDSRLSEFLEGGYWRHGYERNGDEAEAKRVWRLFDQIQVGDEFAIKGLGGRADLKIWLVGRVIDIDAETGRVALEKREVPLFQGKAPGASGAGNWRRTLLEVTRPDVIQMIFGQQGVEPMAPPSGVEQGDPLPGKNVILYGPPGTGKTFRLQHEFAERFTERGARKTQEQLADDITADMAWWEACALALLDLGTATVSEMLSHPVILARQRRSATLNARATLWGQLQMHTKRDCPTVAYTNRLEPLIFSKTPDSRWSVDPDLIAAEAPDLPRLLAQWKGFQPSDGADIRRYEFITFHQSYSYEDFVEGIKPTLGGEGEGDLSYTIKRGIFVEMAERARADDKHEYALFIDEINRGNVASIFGELITLLEDDKRIGAKNPIEVILPYSRRRFGVPANLYIIGTMNTADRSVEALDAALRRRFKFMACQPDLEQLPASPVPEINVDLRRLLKAINDRLERLLDKDHCLGHAEFMRVAESSAPLETLRTVMANWVRPLLEEYFYRDPGKIALVLGEAFVKKLDGATRFPDGQVPDEEVRDVFEFLDIAQLDAAAFRSIYE